MIPYLYEYTSAVVPTLSKIECQVFNASTYQDNKTQLIHCVDTPSLSANYIKIVNNGEFEMKLNGTSHVFYVIEGKGVTKYEKNTKYWKTGDVFVLPYKATTIIHSAIDTTVLYYVNDIPLLKYMGVVPNIPMFKPCFFDSHDMKAAVNTIDFKNKNRCGVILGIDETKNTTKTLTHTLWGLYNKLYPQTVQKPHKHNSIAIDFCVFAEPNKVYTLIGNEIDMHGNIVNPTKIIWESGAFFVTPPGLWHSHHNISETNAWVLPIQDAGLHTHLRTLDIQFS